jgi:hypothetical protein
VFRKRSHLPDPGPFARPEASARAIDDGAGREPDGATSDELDALLTQAGKHASLGLPVSASERFRLAKRFVYRVSWPFLRHEVAFNQAIVEANRVLAERITRLQLRIEQGLREDLIDFADRSVSQAHAEISDHVAEARRIHADLILELQTLRAELETMAKAASPSLSIDRSPAVLKGQRDTTGTDGGPHETHR